MRLPRVPFVAPLLLVPLAACGPGERSASARHRPLAEALRALRHVTVGDHRLETDRAALHRPVTRLVGADEHLAGNVSVPSTRTPLPDEPTRVIPFTTTTAEPLTLWLGDTLTLAAPMAPDGTPPSMVRDLRWSSIDPNVATVSMTGTLSARALGSTTIVAWRRVGETAIPVTVLPAVRGRVVAADGGPLRAHVVVHGRSWTDSAESHPDGTFAFRARRLEDDRLTVHIEPLDGSYAPAELTDAPVAQLAALDAVLLPRQWRIETGTYAGTVVSIAPAIAQLRAREGRRFWHVARGERSDAATGAAVGWSDDHLPLAVAFDHHASPLSASDSTAFWGIARQLEYDWGRPLFRPAALPPAALAPDAPSFDGIVVAVDPHIRTAGLTSISWDGNGDVSTGVVAVQSRAMLTTAAVVTHELLHALGMGHASESWSSVMQPVARGASGGRASAEDIAYAQLLYAMRARAMRDAGGIPTTPIGIAEAAAANR